MRSARDRGESLDLLPFKRILDRRGLTEKAGGTVALPKSIIVGVGALMFFRDTEGNVFGAIQFDSKAE